MVLDPEYEDKLRRSLVATNCSQTKLATTTGELNSDLMGASRWREDR